MLTGAFYGLSLSYMKGVKSFMPERTVETGSECFRSDPEMKIRDLLQSGGLPIYRLERIAGEEEKARLELILYFPEHIAAAEDLISKESAPLPDFSRTPGDRRHGDLSPLEYEFSLEGIPVILKMNTLFGQAFYAALSHLESVRASLLSKEIEKLRERALKLEGTFSKMGSPSHGKKKSVHRKSSALYSTGTLDYEEDLINASEVMLYFQIHPSTLERWTSLAEENGISILRDPVNAGRGDEPPEGLVLLMEVLRGLRIRDFLDLKDYICRNLESWEDLYEAFETARFRGLLPSGRITPFKFVWALLEARKD